MQVHEKKVIFIDLDGTLINTRSGKPFPKGVWDMELRMDVFEALRKIHPMAVFLVTNQGGIEKGHVNEHMFTQKLMYVIASLQEYIGLNTFVAGQYCSITDRMNPRRKPNAGMLVSMIDQFNKEQGFDLSDEDCIMIGDRPEDKGAAEKFGCDFLHVDRLLEIDIPTPLFRVISQIDGKDIPGKSYNLSEWEALRLIDRLNEEGNEEVVKVPMKWMVPNPPNKS